MISVAGMNWPVLIERCVLLMADYSTF